MAINLDTVLLRETAISIFEDTVLPFITREHERDGEPDYVARSEGWSNFIDGLWQDQRISDWQLENWEHPDCTEDQ